MDMLLAFLSITFLFFLRQSSSNVAVFEILVNNQCIYDALNRIGKRWVESVRAVLSVEMYQGIDGFVCLCFRQKYLRLFFVGGFLFLLYSTIMETIKGRSICNSLQLANPNIQTRSGVGVGRSTAFSGRSVDHVQKCGSRNGGFYGSADGRYLVE